MRASLDTNVLIHLYRAGLQRILFEFFEDGVFIYEQIRTVELEHHGQDVLSLIDQDIEGGKIQLYTDANLKELGIHKIFAYHVKENRDLYSPKDLGEVYAISLAQTLGAYSLVTDDIKQGGPYMSLLQFEDAIIPFTFVDLLILRFLMGHTDAEKTLGDFETVNVASHLNWTFKRHFSKFIQRFWKEPYKKSDRVWMDDLVSEYQIDIKEKLRTLRNLL